MTKMYISDHTALTMIYHAGWTTREDAITALAISIGEAGDPADPHRRIDAHALGDRALVTDKWGPSVGTMQIRSVKAERGTGSTRDQDANLSPQICYDHAHHIWVRYGWHPWSVWLHGTYRAFLGRAARAADDANPPKFTLSRYLYWRPGAEQDMLHGNDVQHVQLAAGLRGPGPHGADGWYGPYTESKIREVQSHHHIAVDGIVGPVTTHALGGLWKP